MISDSDMPVKISFVTDLMLVQLLYCNMCQCAGAIMINSSDFV